MDLSTRSRAIAGVAQNLVALTIAGVTLYVAMLIGIRWAAFALITVGVFFAGYCVTYGLLWLGFRGRALRVAAFLSAPLWLGAGAIVAHAAYQTDVRCGPGPGTQRFEEVAGARVTDIRGRPTETPCLPDPRDVAATLLAQVGRR